MIAALVLAAVLAPSASATPLDEARVLELLQSRSAPARLLQLEVERDAAALAQEGLHADPWLRWGREDGGGAAAPAEDRLELSLALPTGSGATGRALARAGSRWRQVEAARERALLRREALARFHEAVVAAAQAGILRGSVDELAEARRVLAAREQAGHTSGYELSRLAIEEQLLRARLGLAEGAAEAARHQLARLLGVDPGGVALPPSLPAADVAGLGWEQRADVVAAREAAAAGGSALTSLGNWFPAAELSLGRLWVEGQDEAGFTAGASVQLPLFDRGQERRARWRAQRRLESARLAALEATALAGWESARARLDRASASLARLDDQLPGRIDLLLAAARSGYAEGRLGIHEWLDAHRLARRAALERLELEHARAAAAADLRLAGGGL